MKNIAVIALLAGSAAAYSQEIMDEVELVEALQNLNILDDAKRWLGFGKKKTQPVAS